MQTYYQNAITVSSIEKARMALNGAGFRTSHVANDITQYDHAVSGMRASYQASSGQLKIAHRGCSGSRIAVEKLRKLAA